MYSKTFQIVQQTPHINFQYRQSGATLRATELKPKLDAWIMRRMLMDEGEPCYEDHLVRAAFFQLATSRKPEWNRLLVGKGKSEHRALDYRVRLTYRGESERFVITSNPASGKADPERERKSRQYLNAEYLSRTQYFADNQFISGKDLEYSKIRLGLRAKEPIWVSVSSLNRELLAMVAEEFEAFLVSTNFGSRQSKGFGCYLPQRMSDDRLIELLKRDERITGVFQKESMADFRRKLQIIGAEYGQLKRGTSYPNYIKSSLWKYMCSAADVRWEKRKVKKHLQFHHPSLFSGLKYDMKKATFNRIDDCDNRETTGEYQYVRALLGLADQLEFEKQWGNERLAVKIKDTLEDSPLEHLAVKRFRSPIRYLITDTSIFLVTYRINPLLQTNLLVNPPVPRQFEFIIVGASENEKFNLTVPTDFDLADFIEEYADYGYNLK